MKALLIVATFFIGDADPFLFAPMRAYPSFDECEDYAKFLRQSFMENPGEKALDRVVTGCMPLSPAQIFEFNSSLGLPR